MKPLSTVEDENFIAFIQGKLINSYTHNYV